jgi:hypothetical protein
LADDLLLDIISYQNEIANINSIDSDFLSALNIKIAEFV